MTKYRAIWVTEETLQEFRRQKKAKHLRAGSFMQELLKPGKESNDQNIQEP